MQTITNEYLRRLYIVIMHVHIEPEQGNPVLRRCTILLSLTQTCLHPAPISTPKGAYNACCHERRKALLEYIAITSCQVLIFYGWVNQTPHDSIAAHGGSNPPPFGYEPYDLNNCAIRARIWNVSFYIVLLFTQMHTNIITVIMQLEFTLNNYFNHKI